MMKYEKDCEHPFFIGCKYKICGIKQCDVDLEDGTTLSYMPVPEDVRFSFAPITRFYKTEEGQKLIADRLREKQQSIEEQHNTGEMNLDMDAESESER